MNAGPAGFRGAPFTKALVVATVFTGVATQAATRTTRRTAPFLLETLSHSFTFRNPSELLFGALLIYYFRILERQMGTSKYGAYAFITFSLSSLFQSILTNIFRRPSASGLYSLIFSNIVAFCMEIPALQKFKVFGFNVNDKSFIYLAAMQLLFSSGQRSVAAGLCGALAGVFYHFNILGLRRFRLPRVLDTIIAATFGNILVGPRSTQHIPPPQQQQQQQQQQGTRGSQHANTTTVNNTRVEPSMEAIEQLVDMGFDPGRAREALQVSNNNIELALQSLL